MARGSGKGSDGYRADLFSTDERKSFRKEQRDTTLAPTKRADGLFKVTAAPGQIGKSRIGFHGDKTPSTIDQGVVANVKSSLDPRSIRIIWLGITLVLAYFGTLLLPDNVFDINNRHLSLAWFIEILQRNVNNFVTLLSGGGAYGGMDATMIRLCIIGLAGAALATSGAALQGSLKNQLASPSTLGVMQGAQCGGLVFLLLSTASTQGGLVVQGTLLQQDQAGFANLNIIEYIWAVWQQSFFSLAGSTIVVCIVLFVARLAGHGRSSRVALIVSGQVVATLISSFAVVVRLYIREYGTEAQLDAMSSIMAGGFSTMFTLPSLVVVGIPLLTCITVVILMRNRLNLLAFDESEARSMGISTRGLRIVLVACCTIMTAVVVAFCGTVGYVGFLIPHLARRIVGPDFKYLVPASALLGASFLIIVYYVFMCFSIPSGSLSTVTSILGVIAFVIVVFTQRRSGYASW